MLLNKENGKLSFYSKIFLILFIPASIYLLTITILSLSWRMQGDHVMLFYVSFLIDHYHRIPYAEIYEMNFPGTYFISLVIGRLTNYSDFGVRIADIFILSSISILTFKFTKKFSLKSAFISVVVFALIYFLKRPFFTLQREYYIVAFLSVILFLNVQKPFRETYTNFFTGILIGACSTIKPQASIIILAFTLYKYLELKYFEKKTKISKEVFLCFIRITGGFLLPVVAIVLWLYYLGGLSSFIDMAINYLPMYASINQNMSTLTGFQLYSNLMSEVFLVNGMPLFLIGGALGAYFSFFKFNLEIRLRKDILLLCILTVFFFFYTIFTGQYWLYHWLPFTYLTSVLFSLCFIESGSIKKAEKYYCMFFVIFAVLSLFTPYQGFLAQLKGDDVDSKNLSMVSEISSYLDKNASDEDEVQPIDYMGGTGDALLKSRKNISTKFVYDIQFYHNVSNPYIINLRNEFINSLKLKQPKFIVKIISDMVYPKGNDVSANFPERERFIEENYFVDLKGKGYLIYKHK